MIISWTAPANNGSPITAYQISILQSDGVTFTQDLTNCPGSDPAVMSGLSCTIPVSSLMSSPFNLNWGSSVYAVVTATNAYGNSLSSNSGNGATLMTKPDAPISLLENASARTASSISFSWSPGVSNGGGAIIDYRVSYA